MSGNQDSDRKTPGSVIVDGVPQHDGRRPSRARLLSVGAAILAAGALALFGEFGAGETLPNGGQPSAGAATATTVSLATPAADPAVVPRRFEVFLAGLEVPNDLVFGPAGGLFFSETGADRATRVEIASDGSAGEAVVVASGIADAGGLALSDDGVLFVSDSDVVYRVADGVVTRFADGFEDAEGLALGPQGDLYVADDAVAGVTDSGSIRITRVDVRSDGTAGAVTEVTIVPGGGAADIDFGPNGELFVANNLDTVWVVEFGGDGAVKSLPRATFAEAPNTLAFDPSGTLYVGSGDSIWSIEPGDSPGLYATGFDMVEGLVFDTFGNLYVANVGENQILRERDSLLLPVETVRLEGGAFFERATADVDSRRGFGLMVAPETLADDLFFDRGWQWDEGPLWWEGGAVNPVWGDAQPRWIELDLGGSVTIGSAVVQADDNDEYLLSYRDLTSGEWEPLWRIPSSPRNLPARTNTARHIERTVFPEPVATDRLRFEAWSGDGMYSVSEIQVFAAPKLEAGTGATTGTITIQASDWRGVDGHRLFALVDDGYSVVGGAFWIRVDGDPFSGQDFVHPYERTFSGGIAEEYLWGETARLEPGTYQVTLYLDPVELLPFGHALPRSPIERQCTIEVVVTAGRNTVAVVGATPGSEYVSCPSL